MKGGTFFLSGLGRKILVLNERRSAVMKIGKLLWFGIGLLILGCCWLLYSNLNKKSGYIVAVAGDKAPGTPSVEEPSKRRFLN
jgi:hypothetical protein